ncbi:MAG: HupE/UreJ family protein [Paracoccaceae bacterium]
MKRLLILPALFAATPAFAHLDPAAHGSFAAGFSHPVFGPDHILAMVAVGLWATVMGGRARLVLPMAFVGTMSAGFALALAGMPLPMVEPMILASVLLLGVLTALALPLPLGVAATITGALALFHGHAHGAEMGGATALSYLAGFALSTAFLHAAGVLGGMLLARFGGPMLTRAAGVLVALSGSALVLAG